MDLLVVKNIKISTSFIKKFLFEAGMKNNALIKIPNGQSSLLKSCIDS
jgi:hypothetical protein